MRLLSNFFSNNITSRGFLFTISVILFASTLVFFAQNYSSISSSNERGIIFSAKPINVILLNDDIALDLSKLLHLSIDVNDSGANVLLLSGDMNSTYPIITDLTNYASFLSTSFFSRSIGTKSLDLNSLTDGAAEIYFGGDAVIDYNYSTGVSVYPISGASLTSIDLNLLVSSELNSYSWSKSSGVTPITLIYRDDANTFTITDSIDLNESSVLTVLYSGGNLVVGFGRNQISGSDRNSSITLVPMTGQKMSYSLSGAFAPEAILLPIRFNSVLSFRQDSFDSNSFITLKK